MGNNLKDRLQRIRDFAGPGHPRPGRPWHPQPERMQPRQTRLPEQTAASFGPEWKPAGFEVLHRQIKTELPMAVPKTFCDSLVVIIRDFVNYSKIPKPEDLVFFDLETTGLSGGAGTLAFLASFGRLVSVKTNPRGKVLGFSLVIEQYLLLDYPGESDFLEKTKEELQKTGPSGSPRMIISYNGKTFDSQIINNRCLVNGIIPPVYFHADLLYPSRRLWKRVLPNCSQGTVETLIPGLDRTADIPGAMAPDIWFSFLRTGNPKELMGICAHNILDIKGLASICLLMEIIAKAPLKTLDKFSFDLETLALLWRKEQKPEANELLEKAAELHMPRALCVLAKDAEWLERDCNKALSYTESALDIPEINESLRIDLERRRERLQKKIEKKCN